MAPRLEQARGLADGILGAIAGDLGEGRVDMLDHAVGAGDHDAFGGIVEELGGKLEALLGAPFGGNPARDAQQADDPAVRGAHRRLEGVVALQAAVGVLDVLLTLLDADFGHHLRVGLAEGVGRCRRKEVAIVLAEDLFDRPPHDLGRRAVDQSKAALGVLEEDHVRAGIEQRRQQRALFFGQLEGPRAAPIDQEQPDAQREQQGNAGGGNRRRRGGRGARAERNKRPQTYRQAGWPAVAATCSRR